MCKSRKAGLKLIRRVLMPRDWHSIAKKAMPTPRTRRETSCCFASDCFGAGNVNYTTNKQNRNETIRDACGGAFLLRFQEQDVKSMENVT